MSDRHDDPSTYPALGRWMTWVDRPGSATKIFRGLIVVCVLVVLADLTYTPYGYLPMEKWFGFYAGYGFVMFTVLILLAKGLRVLIKRREDYYGDKAVDQEDYPDDGTDRREHGDV